MPPLKHTHKYKLKNLGTKEKPRKVYACVALNCTHYMPVKRDVVNKLSVCWQCDKEFTVTADIPRKSIVKPRCLVCRGKIKKTQTTLKLDKALELFMIGKANG